jgi:hypothetical protein
VPDDFYGRSSVGETGVDHFVGAREQRGRPRRANILTQ